MADEDVLGDVQIGEDHRLLIDGGNAVSLCLLRVMNLHGLPIQQDFTPVTPVNACGDLDEG